MQYCIHLDPDEGVMWDAENVRYLLLHLDPDEGAMGVVENVRYLLLINK